MGFFLKGLLALIWLLAVPAFAGILFFRKGNSPKGPDCLLVGYLFSFSLFELLCLPMIYFGLPLHVLVFCYGMLTGAAALAGIFRLVRIHALRRAAQKQEVLCSSEEKNPRRFSLIGWLRGSSPFFWAALALIAFQLVVVALYAHFDADDAFFVAAGTTAVETDTIFEVNAYVGIPHWKLQTRYILSPFPIFLAVISQLCGGLHPAIMAHTIFPPVFLVCVYSLMYRIAQKWFENDRNAQGIFLFLTALLAWFSAYSIYNTGTFQMVRLWQGKAMLTAFMLPLLLYLSSSVMLEETPRYPWLLLFMANFGCCLLSSMGIILAPLMMGIFIFLGLLRFRSLKRTALGLACCLPSVVLGITYILIR